ncbi:NERD domain-containing protein [Pseudaeromonas paramecii]|uniref:NERD domain-containing protein n=1 Tax=Pseudaeromonas paramecii TaxID=2138166 RepID=A0ABP8QF71_9GAMM
MDLTLLLNPLLSQLYILLPAFLLVLVIKSPWFKGKLGEFFVNTAVRWRLDKDVYHLVKDVTLPTEDGSTQIDHLIVSVYGVFVVETKNMRGWIFGGEQQRTWTQKIYKQTHKFQNPLFQNYKHTKTLQTLLGLEDGQLFSVIAFVGDASFKTPMPENVTTGAGYLRYILRHQATVLSEARVAEILTQIEAQRLAPGFKTNRAHVAHLRQKHGKPAAPSQAKPIMASQTKPRVQARPADSDMVPEPPPGTKASVPHTTLPHATSPHTAETATPACPKCGDPMVLRQVKQGARAGERFWGCSHYPHCRSRLPLAPAST